MKYQRLEIFRPTISDRITQGWGENRACITADRRVIGTNSVCPPGTQSYYKWVGMQGHNGIDIGGFSGSDIYHAATFPGYMRTEKDVGGGIGVDVISERPLFFPGPIPSYLKPTAIPYTQNGEVGFLHHVKMRYWHLKAPVGHDGKQVTVGTTVGLMGNTGASSGVHLHFAPKWCDENGGSVGSYNGYFGAFDPTPFYMHQTTALEHSKLLRRDTIPLSPAERKDMLSHLSTIERLLRSLQNLSA